MTYEQHQEYVKQLIETVTTSTVHELALKIHNNELQRGEVTGTIHTRLTYKQLCDFCKANRIKVRQGEHRALKAAQAIINEVEMLKF